MTDEEIKEALATTIGDELPVKLYATSEYFINDTKEILEQLKIFRKMKAEPDNVLIVTSDTAINLDKFLELYDELSKCDINTKNIVEYNNKLYYHEYFEGGLAVIYFVKG